MLATSRIFPSPFPFFPSHSLFSFDAAEEYPNLSLHPIIIQFCLTVMEDPEYKMKEAGFLTLSHVVHNVNAAELAQYQVGTTLLSHSCFSFFFCYYFFFATIHPFFILLISHFRVNYMLSWCHILHPAKHLSSPLHSPSHSNSSKNAKKSTRSLKLPWTLSSPPFYLESTTPSPHSARYTSTPSPHSSIWQASTSSRTRRCYSLIWKVRSTSRTWRRLTRPVYKISCWR